MKQPLIDELFETGENFLMALFGGFVGAIFGIIGTGGIKRLEGFMWIIVYLIVILSLIIGLKVIKRLR